MKKRLLIAIMLVLTVFAMGCGTAPISGPVVEEPTVEELMPAEFIVDNLQVVIDSDADMPCEVVSVDVQNTGGTKGVYDVTFVYTYTEDGVGKILEDTQSVELAAGQKKNVTSPLITTLISACYLLYRNGEDWEPSTLSVNNLSKPFTLASR